MIRFILFRFWPALLPLLIYWLWHRWAVSQAKRNNRPIPRFRDGPIYWAVLASLLIAVGCFFWLGAHLSGEKGDYVPPHVENGVLVPGHTQ